MLKPAYSINNLSTHLFWDVDKSALDINASDALIIHRVLEYGILNDWKIITAIYGLDHIKKVVVKLRTIDDVTLSFLCALFNLNKSDFRCYTQKQSTPHFWNY